MGTVPGLPAIGQDVGIGRHFTADNIELGLTGLVAGLGVGLAWRVVGRARWGAVPFLLAVFAAARHNGRTDWIHWDDPVITGAVVVSLAGIGAARLLAQAPGHWHWVAAGALFSAAGVWAGVPETGPALLMGGAFGGLAVSATVTRARWGASAGLGMAAALGWAALSGAAGRPWAAIGGAMCTGVAPWFALVRLFPGTTWRRAPGPWVLAAHMVLVVLASRWIGVVPHAGWWRVAAVGIAGLGVAVAASRRA